VTRTVRLRIDLAYHGGPFAGFARQPGLTTVQGELERALAELVGHEVRTVAAGRTDRGVHADAQVVHADVTADGLPRSDACDRAGTLDHGLIARLLDAATPDAIRVLLVREVDARFDARFAATSRSYRYRLMDGLDPRAPGPTGAPTGARGVARDAPDVWGLVARLDVPAMRQGGHHLLGEHDFAAFCRAAPGRTSVRRIDLLTVRRLGPAPGRIDVRVVGPAFCHQQVRSIVGCLVEVGRGRRPPAWVAEVLAARDRSRAAPVAPPHGLTLERVGYGRVGPAAPPSPPSPGEAGTSRGPDPAWDPPRRRGLPTAG